ncbi:hypothetical protein HanRHA438_Chr03g0124871 [Helianthus annuus]|uniref:Uncharacterized protein n=1 Tax=Helianthus annuus TaxID=4232 RepID=A0A251V754_HELAN|nr:uncharacterized protein LOC110929625 isoform X1 [Helianthus annuus]KAF5814603.1 hypothetical protein HanXRQr2_Chr03g0112931 [Helianthus annuus]KAJ0593184.1 hypothetical protein HanHA300_Chr03g0094201 [Helianthus annuus]KAJ0600997.1 hypothetical protein HanIR_Chr03g0123411 [Helianthus annuus]KAJ0608198.1 hypothetical protein HanHA89_Chr03g0105921 [Helianthus annuus]KAJ0768261.1 hypothetical protein HanLR1_Chr03g0099271 [Helianthus annuus]
MGGVGLMAANSIVRPPSPGRGSEVFVAAVPLTAAKGPPQLVMSAAYSLSLSWDLQHFMVLSTLPTLPSQVLVFDFQPQDPENVYAALAALSGRKIPGVLLTRKMKKLPNMRCWKVGSCNVDVEDVIHGFNSSWDTDLIVGQHDCRHYTNGLVECLTGEKDVLDRLRRSRTSTFPMV